MSYTKHAIWLFALLVFFTGCTSTNNLDMDLRFCEGVEFYKIKKFEKSFSIISELANKNYPPAQAMLGSMYASGLGVDSDSENAVYWYEESAKNGFIPAMLKLAQYYYRGEIAQQNCNKSLYWYGEAVKHGSSKAMYAMHMIYEGSFCASMDIQKSNNYLILASKQDDDMAKLSLGVMYYLGIGVKKNYLKSKKIFESISKSNAEAIYYLSRLYFFGYGADKNVEMAIGLLKKASEMGNLSADYALSVLYYNGKEIDRDYVKSFEYAKKSALAVPKASYLLGVMYEYGLIGNKDLSLAKQWYQEAASSGNIEARNALLRIESRPK